MSIRRILLLAGTAACGSVSHDAPADASQPGDATVANDAACAQVLDQQVALCASPPITQCIETFVSYSSDGVDKGGQISAQVFTPQNTGSVTRLRLHGHNDVPNSNPVEVTIIDLQNNATIYTDTSFVAADHVLARASLTMGTTDNWYDVTFPSAAHVVAGKPYAINVRLLGTTKPAQGMGMHWSAYNDYQGGTDTYPRGNLIFCQYGKCTIEPATQDAVFEVNVAPDTCN